MRRRSWPPRTPCVDCGRPSSGTRCMACYQRSKPPPRERRPDLDDRAEKARRRRAVQEWVSVAGWNCPGFGDRPPHPATDLCADHATEVALGGPAQPSGFGILCRSCNSAKSNIARSRAARVALGTRLTGAPSRPGVPDRDW